MPRLHYHPVYAWNFIDDLHDCGCLHGIGTYAQEQLGRGRAEGWITPQTKLRARMFAVYADDVMMPAPVDSVGWGALQSDGHVSDLREFEMTHASSTSEALSDGIIETLLETHGEQSLTRDDVLSLLSWWDELQEFEDHIRTRFSDPEVFDLIDAAGIRHSIAAGGDDQVAALGIFPEHLRSALVRVLKDDPLRRKPDFIDVQQIVDRELGTMRYAHRLADAGIPTLAHLRARSARHHELPNELDVTDAIVTLYFRGVSMPVPETAKEALHLRTHPSILHWRGQMADWTREVASGGIDLRRVGEQIEDANKYLAGASLLRNALSVFSPTVCFPAAIAAAALNQPLLSGGLLAIEGLKAYGDLVHAAVRSPDRLNHKWLMLSPE